MAKAKKATKKAAPAKAKSKEMLLVLSKSKYIRDGQGNS